MKRKTPQEKKALSYARDCRNTYGESDKGSRVSIKRNKTFPKRAYRKTVNNLLQTASGAIDLEQAEAIDIKAKEIKRRKWKKRADTPLGEIIKERLKMGERPIRRKLSGVMKNLIER
jgi:hypothetical protein